VLLLSCTATTTTTCAALQAPSMQWNEGHTWTLDVQLPVGAVNFKIVMHDQPNSNVRWELGDDRSVLIPETTTVTGAPVGHVSKLFSWNSPLTLVIEGGKRRRA
jgi:hypothetical protein